MNELHDQTKKHLCSRSMRLGHLLWHASRERWEQLSPAVKALYRATWPDWVPPRPSLDAHGRVILGTGAGLDFLYAHRRMIQHVNAMQATHGSPPVSGWTALPGPEDRTHAVPRSLFLPEGLFRSKDNALWSAMTKEALRYTARGYLRSISLDVLGTQIEYGIHAAMHERFGGLTPHGRRLGQFDILRKVAPKWDKPDYDTLLDFYSAHVHPCFWCIHGWVDDRITDWERANDTLADFHGAWEGPMKQHHGPHPHGGPAIALLTSALTALTPADSGGWVRPRLLPPGWS